MPPTRTVLLKNTEVWPETGASLFSYRPTQHEGSEHVRRCEFGVSASGRAPGRRCSPGRRPVCGGCLREEQHAVGGGQGVSPQHAGGQAHLLAIRRAGGRRQPGQPHSDVLQPGEPSSLPAALIRLGRPAAPAGLSVPERRHRPRRRPRLLEGPGEAALPPPALHVLRVPRPPARPPEPDLRHCLRPALQSPGLAAAEGSAPDPGCHQGLSGVQRVEGELSALSSAAPLRLPDERLPQGLTPFLFLSMQDTDTH